MNVAPTPTPMSPTHAADGIWPGSTGRPVAEGGDPVDGRGRGHDDRDRGGGRAGLAGRVGDRLAALTGDPRGEDDPDRVDEARGEGQQRGR